MTHFQNLLNRLDAVEHFLWILLDGRGDNFWCILVKNSCYDEKDVEEPKSFLSHYGSDGFPQMMTIVLHRMGIKSVYKKDDAK